ncbi:MAG: hypothetical protein WBF75_12950 [Pseudonocardiaceae bacterium]
MTVAGGLAAVVAAATVWRLTQVSATDIAKLLGPSLVTAVFGLSAPLIMAWVKSVSDDQLLETAKQLARKVHDQEASALARLMADSGDLKPADVSFAPPTLTYWRDDGGNRQRTLRKAAGYYRSLKRGRLVVLGEPGAGKTVLAIQLVLDLAEAVLAVADDTRPLPRVPVRLSLSAFDFDPRNDLDVTAAQVVSDRLDRWLIQHLNAVFGLSIKVATPLVNRGWILPVLDGLDEMDPDDVEPRRAASVVRAVNHPSAGGVRPVVVTCRTSRYEQLSGPFGSTEQATPAAREATLNVGRREVVQDATVVGVEPLTALSVVNYLTYRFPHPADRVRWRPIVERLTASKGSDDPLAAALGSPLRLFLTVTAYHHPASTPDELTRLATAAELDEHLFARLVPAVLEQHRPPIGRHYAAPEVIRWLTTLARHLVRQGEGGGSPSDLRLDLLWSAAGRRAPRYAATAVTTTAAGALLAVGVLTKWPPDVLPVLGLGAFVVVAAWIALRPAIDLRRLDFNSLRTYAGRKRISWLLGVGLAAGIAAGLIVSLVSPAVGVAGLRMVTPKFITLGLVGALIVGLGSGPATRPTAIDRPARLVRQGLTHTIAAMVAFSLALILADKFCHGLKAGVVGALVAGLAVLFAILLVIGLAGGLAVGLAVVPNSGSGVGLPFAVVSLVVGLIFAANSPWLRYMFATMLLAQRGDLPRRPAVFLDWAYQAGLMRLSGIAVQFRHREFQAWLANRDQRGHGPRPRLLTTGTAGPSTGNKN